MTANGPEEELRGRLKAPADNPEQALFVSAPLKHTGRRDGQGRERLRALRTVRRALPHGRLGHAEDASCKFPYAADEDEAWQSRKRQTAVNDFVIKLANVNGTGSASANSLLMKAIFRMGVPVAGQELFPVQYPGPADLVRDPRQSRRLRRPRAGTST